MDSAHDIHTEHVEDECYITLVHEMSKEHYISFIAAIKEDGCEMKKLYPEGTAEARFKNALTCRWQRCPRTTIPLGLA